MKKATLHLRMQFILLALALFFTFSATAQFTKLLDFNGTNGMNPHGSLLSDGTYLYGMTRSGGANSDGVIFRIKPDGSGDTNLLDFNNTNGNDPEGSLISDGTYLYGMTLLGGTRNDGVIFRIKPDGSGDTNLLDFNGTNGNGPEGSLISDGIYLYGMASQGGANSDGVIFRIKPDGSGDTNLLDFNGTNGNFLNGSLLSAGTYLYGMATEGGVNNDGVIFRYYFKHTSYISESACDSVVSPSGKYTWKTGGIFMDTIPSKAGCDSVMTINATVNPLPTVNVTGKDTIIQGSTDTLTASGGVTYAWTSGSSADTTMVSPMTKTTYTVTVTDGNGCKDTASFTVYVDITTSVANIGSGSTTVYPNPVINTLNIAFRVNENTEGKIEVCDAGGRVISASTETLNNGKAVHINVANLAQGMYFVRVVTAKQTQVIKFIKQ